MTDAAILYRAICASPNDDAPRLALADELEATEPERAEFIRVQCRLAGWSCNFKQTKEQPGWFHDCGTDDRGYWLCQPLRSREQALWDAGSAAWFAPTGLVVRLGDDVGHPWPVGFVERGFVGRVECTVGQFVGEPCETCHGGGGTRRRILNGEEAYTRKDGPRCPACHGSGRTGLAATLAATCPVREIVLTDREPWGGGNERFYYWYREGEDSYQHLRPAAQLPVALFELLPVPGNWSGHGPVGWTSVEKCRANLSAAAVAFARKLAGLPALVNPRTPAGVGDA